MGFAAILVEHDLDFVRDISTRIVVLHQGKLVLDGTVIEVVNSEPVRRSTREAPCEARQAAKHDAMSRAKLVLRGVSSGYGAVDVVNARIASPSRPGEIFALMGKNGMGKTTLLKTILGFLRVGRQVRLDGACHHRRSQPQLIASGIGYAPQE